MRPYGVRDSERRENVPKTDPKILETGEGAGGPSGIRRKSLLANALPRKAYKVAPTDGDEGDEAEEEVVVDMEELKCEMERRGSIQF